MRHTHKLGLCVALLATSSLNAQTQVTIQASKDNTLYEDANGAVSNGKGPRCFVGKNTNSLERRAVMAFSLSGTIPPFSTITKVDLLLTVEQTGNLLMLPITLHSLNVDWGEGTSVAGCGPGPMCGGGGGSTATTNDATWLHTFFSTKKWQNAGGDFNATASGSAIVVGPGQHTWVSTTGMVADVQGWLDKPNTNFGWLLMGAVAASGIATRENTTVASRPQLVVTYTPPAATVTSTGTGCNGSGATPLTLAANGRPTLGNAAFSLNLTGGPAGTSLFALGFGLIPGGVPLGGGCLLHVNPSPALLVFGGPPSRILPLPIPSQTSLLGAEVVWQGAVGDAVTSLLITSNAVTLRIGT